MMQQQLGDLTSQTAATASSGPCFLVTSSRVTKLVIRRRDIEMICKRSELSIPAHVTHADGASSKLEAKPFQGYKIKAG